MAWSLMDHPNSSLISVRTAWQAIRDVGLLGQLRLSVVLILFFVIYSAVNDWLFSINKHISFKGLQLSYKFIYT